MQEYNALNLIFCQILYALIMQKKGGHFILKVFDIFSAASLDLCYLLSSFYTEVYIVKPNTSRYANSERYIVCKNFKFESSKEFSAKFHASLTILYNSELSIKRVIRFSIPYYFLTRIEEINAIFGQQQIETINNTLTLINMIYPNVKQEKIEYYKKNNIQKCINWCIKYKVSYNKIMSTSSNIFQ
jgi:cap1 methyltransferase